MKYEYIPESSLSRHTFVSAEVETHCDGCGEIRITPGDTMMVAVGPDGDVERHYCLRCILAIDVKMRHHNGGVVQITPGSLKLEKLSSPFRKAWLALCKELVEARKAGHEELFDAAIRRFAEAMGCSLGDNLLETAEGRQKREAQEAREAKLAHRRELYRKRKELQMKKEQDEIRRLSAELSELRRSVSAKAEELAAHFLAAKVAHMKGDNAKYQEEHGASAAILLELQRMGGEEVKHG